MASTNPLYTPWDSIPYNTDLVKIQSVVTYCASRFRVSAAALTKLNLKDSEERELFLKHFCSELLFCLSYVGLAAAIGHPVDVPVLIRALACDYYRRGNDLAILEDTNFVLSLDAGTAEDDPAAIVDRYAYGWWTQPLAENMAILAESNIEECLEYHHLLAKTLPDVPGRFEKSKYTWCRDPSMSPWGVNIECRRCRLYRGVSIGVADEVLDFRHQFQGWEAYFKTHSYAVARESVGFFQLQQAAIQMELKGGGPDAGGPDAGGPDAGGSGMLHGVAASGRQSRAKAKFNQATRLHSEQVRLEAAAELLRLQNVPNVKWTSGPDLTDDDALKYLRSTAAGPEVDHSGYAESLPGGLEGDWSSQEPSTFFRSGKFSDPPQDVQHIRDLVPHEYPTHFEQSPLRHYFGEPPVVVDGRLEEPPATPPKKRPVSVLHPPPADYIPHPDTNFNHGTRHPAPAGTSLGAGGTDVFTPANSSIEEIPTAVRGRDVFSASPVEGNLIAVGGRDVFSESSEEGSAAVGGREVWSSSGIQNYGTWHPGPPGTPPGVGGTDVFSISSMEEIAVRGRDVFSDSPVEVNLVAVGGRDVFSDSSAEGSAAVGGSDVLSGSGIHRVEATSSVIGGRDVFSDSEDEGDSDMVGGGEVYSDFSEDDDSGQKVGIGGHGVFSDSEDEAEEVTPAPVLSGRFTAADFQMPIPESWLTGDASDTE